MKKKVKKELAIESTSRQIYLSNVNTYSIDIVCDIKDASGVIYKDKNVHITLSPSYSKSGDYKGTRVKCSIGCCSYSGLRKKFREYDLEEALEIIHTLTFSCKNEYFHEKIKGISLVNVRIKRILFCLKVKYSNFSSKIALMSNNNITSITGYFEFAYADLNFSLFTNICLNDSSYDPMNRKCFIDDDLKVAFRYRESALDYCELIMDDYIRQQVWANAVEL